MTLVSAAIPGPVYLCLGSGRESVAELPAGPDFDPLTIRLAADYGSDLVIFSTGFVLNLALAAARDLAKTDIRYHVADVTSLKSLDQAGILELLKPARAVISVYEHQANDGLGSALAEFPASITRYPPEADRFHGHVRPLRSARELLDKYRFSPEDFAAAVVQTGRYMPVFLSCRDVPIILIVI